MASLASTPMEAASPGDVARSVVVRQHGRRPARVPERRLALRDRRPDRGGRPGRLEQGPVEDEVTIGGEAGGGLHGAVEQLAHGHPAGRLVEDRPEAADERREVRLVTVVQVDLPVPRGPARPGRVGSQLGILEEGVEDVQPEPVDAAGQPAADHLELGRLHAGCPPVHLRLLDQEGVVVELLATRLPAPARPAEVRDPVVGWQRRAGRIAPGRVAPQVPIGVRTGAIGARRDEPRMGVAGVVHDQVEDDPDPAAVRLRDQPVEIRLRSEQRIDPFVIAHVVAEVEPRRRVDRRQPDRVDAEAVRTEVVEVLDDPRQVPHPIARRVGEAARIDLVDDPALPPVVTEAGRLDDGSHARGPHRRSPVGITSNDSVMAHRPVPGGRPCRCGAGTIDE